MIHVCYYFVSQEYPAKVKVPEYDNFSPSTLTRLTAGYLCPTDAPNLSQAGLIFALL